MAEFKDRFRQLRNEKDMSQEVLANDFNSKFHYNFGKSSISMYENGKRMPEINALEDFATYFEVSVDYLLGRVDIKDPYDKRKDKPGNEDSDKDINTIAAHHDGGEFTDEEMEDISSFIENFVIKKRKES